MTKTLLWFNEGKKNKTQINHIFQVLEAFVQAAVPSNVISAFRNAEISLILEKMTGPDETELLYLICRAAPDRSRCMMENPFDIEEIVAAIGEEKDDEEDDPAIETCGSEIRKRQ
jgi:hypothetical protein